MRRTIATTAVLGLLLLPSQLTTVATAASYQVKYTSFSTPVARGHQAKVSIHTGPDGKCSLKVTYQNGVVKPAGTGTKYANGSGNATWSWIVPSSTTPGTYPVTVTCQSGGNGAKATKQMTITR